jgi:hypothetical protein
MGFIQRIGVFFLWIGAFCLFLFFISSASESANMNLLIAGFLLVVVGMLILFKNPTEKQDSNRFRLFRAGKARLKKSSAPKSGNRDSAQPRRTQDK